MSRVWDLEKLALIGTEKYPLRASALQKMVKCPMSTLLTIFEGDESAGQAADTGSAVHKAASSWHLNNTNDVAAAIKAMRDNVKDYPLADLAESEQLFRSYSKDKRNKEAKTVLIEEKVKITLSPSKEDETKEPIIIIGHLDQIREENGVLKLYDIKTTKKSGAYALQESLYQMAAYCLGATLLLKKQVEPGALILPRQYNAPSNRGILSPHGVFFHIPWGLREAPIILDGLRNIVAQLRKGKVWVNPGDYCNWCPARSTDFCIPKLRNLDTALQERDRDEG